MRLETLGLIGNCQSAALVDTHGRVVWCCLPRFDSEPLFGRLLDDNEGGDFGIEAADGRAGVQRYLDNSNILETVFDGADGAFRVLDFFPRFEQHGRMFRPTLLLRIVEPLHGAPRLRIHCEPRLGWSRVTPQRQQGSNHIRYEGFASPLRLTTDVPLSYLDGTPFALTERRHLVLSWGPPVEEPLAPLCERFLDGTLRYWQRWVKHCNIPPRYQREVLRSALTLKLHCYEDTGAIVAATTTSIPESPGSGRTWDYRYCWLRDAYYTLDAFRLLGHFEEREHFIQYLLNIAAAAPDLDLKPLYRIDGRSDLDEQVLASWPGYEGHGPVRIGNAAALHQQHDVFGEMVLALTPVFMDERFQQERTPATLALIERLARKALSVAGTPDAGIWELRTQWQPQTFSTLMCWAAADRMARIATTHKPAIAAEFAAAASSLQARIRDEAWSTTLGAFAATHGGHTLDAALLQMVPLGFLLPDDAQLCATLDAIRSQLSVSGWLLRYGVDDGFGKPTVAFVLCTFWLVEALARTGRKDEARVLMDRALKAASPLGLLAEDYDPHARRLCGNFPQAYSHVGLIHAAFAASPGWSESL
ncbi:MAG: glycoside hydrolase family 15 protein [Pseudomonadota bacterium]